MCINANNFIRSERWDWSCCAFAEKNFLCSVLYENVHLDCLCWWLPSRCKNHSFWPLLHLSVMRKCLNQIENIIEPKIFNNRLCERTQYSKSHPLWGKLNEPLNTTIGCHMAIKFFINPFYNIDFWTFVWMNSFLDAVASLALGHDCRSRSQTQSIKTNEKNHI